MTGYAAVNGIQLYYEVHSSGEPLILLHGGLGSTEMSRPIQPALAATRRVIAVDLQGHGRTADIDRPITHETMADDIAGLMEHLGLARADVLGYSLGSGVAMRLAIQHPAMVRKLMAVAAPFRRDGWYPEILDAVARMNGNSSESMKASPLYQQYLRVAPRPEDWPRLCTKLRDLIAQDYDWSRELVALKNPVLLVFADADAVRPAHIVQFFELLGGGKRDAGWDGSGRPASRLAILPGRTHYDVFSSPELVAAVIPFLNAQ